MQPGGHGSKVITILMFSEKLLYAVYLLLVRPQVSCVAH